MRNISVNISRILNSDQLLKRCCLKIFLFLALVAFLFRGAKWFVEIRQSS